jgi:hypothetical protein
MAKVTVTVPHNVTYATDDHVYREGETLELERDELVDAFIRYGNLVEVKPSTRKK